VDPDGPSADSSLYVTTALAQSRSPVFTAEVVPVSRLASAALEGRSAVVLNDVGGLPGPAIELLRRFVEQGGGLFIALSERTPSGLAGSTLLPGALGAMVDRSRAGVPGTLGFIDFSHPVFELFKQPHNGDLRAPRFQRYRALTPAETDQVLARFDDGGAAFVERRVGAGRVIAFTSSLDVSWNTLPVRSVFVPLTHLVFRHLTRYEEPEAWHTVGRMLDVSGPVAQIVREGGLSSEQARRATGVVMAPSGEQTTLGDGGVAAIRLDEQGFYSTRMQGTGDRRPYAVAVNVDPAESDLTPMDPGEFVTTAAGSANTVTYAGQSLEQTELTPADIEKQQGVWWFLLLAGAIVLLAEAVLSNRLTPRTIPRA
jgi:hypothetical protein